MMRFHMRAHDAPRRPLRQRRTRTSAIRLALRGTAIALVLLVAVAIGAAVIVVTGPTELSLVRDQVIRTLQDGLGEGYTVRAGRSVIDIDPLVGGLVIRVDDIVVEDRAQSIVARVPSTRFSVNALALLTLRLEVNALELSEAEINFVRLEDGSVKLGFLSTDFLPDGASAATTHSQAAEIDGGFPDLIGPLRILDRGLEPPIYAAIQAGFERLVLSDSIIVVWDAVGERQRRFPNSELDIALDARTSRLVVKFSTLGHGGRWTATLDRSLDENTGGHAMTAVFSQLTIADLFPGLGSGPVSVDIPLYGRANINFDDQGGVEAASARIDLGAGIIRFARGRETILLDEATLRLRWDIPNQALIVDRSSFSFGRTRGSVSGRIRAEGDAANRRYAFNLVSPGAVLAPSDSGLRPLIAQQIVLSGTADPRTRMLNIDNASILTSEGSIAAAGSLGFTAATPSLAIAASISPMSIDTLKQMWVPLFAPGSRRWILKNVESGWLASGTFEAAVPAGVLWTGKRPHLAEEAMRLDARVEDLTFKTFGEAPPIVGASGNIVLAGSTFGIDLDGGHIETSFGRVRVEAGAFAIPDTSQRPSSGVVELQLSGSAQALGEIADSEPLFSLSRREIAPSDLSGDGKAAISLRIPLRPGITEADVDWKVVVDTDGLSSKVPVEGRIVTNADVSITVTPGEVGIYGRAEIDGVEADVSIALPALGSNSAQPGARLVRLILDEEARKKLGVGLENMLAGSITTLVSDNQDGGQHYDLDLERARMTIPGIGWVKGIGVPARLAFDISPADDGHYVRNLVFQGDGFGFRGTAKLNQSYGLETADIAHIALREGDSAAIKITRGSSGFAINVRGDSINLQGLISQIKERYEKSGGFPDLALDAEIGRLVGFNQEVITGSRIRLVSVGGETQKLSLRGDLGGSAISLEYAITPKGTTLFGQALDTGRLMRFTDLYTRMLGGAATLQGQGGPTGPMVGTFEVANFQVVNEPAMDRVAVSNPDRSPGSPQGAFDPGRVNFDQLVARFIRSDRSIIIEDALLRGAEVGATFAGRYDVPTTNVVITGTYLPAYALNNLFGQIPILGLALGGGFHEGLIGVTFKVEGPIGKPDIFYNPLSAVAPGIFRKIFEFQ